MCMACKFFNLQNEWPDWVSWNASAECSTFIIWTSKSTFGLSVIKPKPIESNYNSKSEEGLKLWRANENLK